MLGDQMTNQDEDEVEDELAALEAEVSGISMPTAPNTRLPEKTRAKERLLKKQYEEQGLAMMV